MPEKKKKPKRTGAGFSRKFRVFIFLVCLTVSVFLWLIIKLSREYEVVFRYYYTCKNIPSERVIESRSDTMIFLTVRTKGFNILYERFIRNPEPLVLNLKYFRNMHRNSTQEIEFPIVNYTDVLSSQLKFTNQITAVFPERITIKLNKLHRKKVPVIPLLDLTFADQFMQYGKAVVSPDSVLVGGPKGLIDTLSFITTEKYKNTGLKENTSITIPLVLPSKNIFMSLSVKEVNVFIPVEKYTEKEIDVPLIVRNKPLKMDVKTFPDKVKIYCFVALKDFDLVLPSMFSAQVDFNESDKGTNMLTVNVPEYPLNVKVSRFVPQRVEYIIMK